MNSRQEQWAQLQIGTSANGILIKEVKREGAKRNGVWFTLVNGFAYYRQYPEHLRSDVVSDITQNDKEQEVDKVVKAEEDENHGITRNPVAVAHLNSDGYFKADPYSGVMSTVMAALDFGLSHIGEMGSVEANIVIEVSRTIRREDADTFGYDWDDELHYISAEVSAEA